MISVGCTPRKFSQSESDKIKAYRLIDSGHPMDAILFLEQKLTKDKSNRELKFILASAYADQAGIKIHNLIPLINQVSQITKSSRDEKPAKTEISDQDKINLKARVFSNHLRKYSVAFQVFAAIPTITDSNIVYLKHAVRLLEELLNTEATQNIALYKAILDTVLFKYNLMDYMHDDDFTLVQKNCQIDTEKTFTFIELISENLASIFEDLSFARPKQKLEYTKSMLEVKEDANFIKSFIVSMEANNLVLAESLKDSALKNQLGKLLSCTDLK